jgi:hypothetical protein
MPGSLVEVTGEVAGGTELKVALSTPVLGIVLRILEGQVARRGFKLFWSWRRRLGRNVEWP